MAHLVKHRSRQQVASADFWAVGDGRFRATRNGGGIVLVVPGEPIADLRVTCEQQNVPPCSSKGKYKARIVGVAVELQGQRAGSAEPGQIDIPPRLIFAQILVPKPRGGLVCTASGFSMFWYGMP